MKATQPGPAPAAAAAQAAPPAAEEAAELEGGRARVLVVDDDERNLLAIGTVLEDLAEIVTASSGEEALRHLLKGEFAVILLDVFMPGMDGYETAQIIRQRDQTKRIPIVFLSAVNKETQHLMRGYSMGAVDYVFKPVEPVVLRSKVSVFVDLFDKTREIERKAAAEQALLDANLRANEELRLAQQRQAAIIQSVPIVLYLEPVERWPRWPSYISGNFDEITGYSYEVIAENPDMWEARLHPEDRDRVLAALAGRRESGRFSVEYRWRCADGGYKYFHDQAALIRDAAGEPLHFAGTLLDVTGRKELESQLLQARKMDAIGKLTGGVAHDFNNLLAAVLGGIGLIERRLPLDEEQKKIVTMTRRAAEQGSELVGRLLAFARRQQLEPAAVDVGDLSRTVTDLLAHTLGGLVQLEWRLADGVGCAWADAAQLELAVMNLIINARDAMPEGGTVVASGENRRVGADSTVDLPPGDYVVVAVEDEGCGIPPDILEQVTEPFFTTKAIGKGTGLGLSMVYGFARQSGGTLAIESDVGRGTKVEIWLPRAGAEAAAPLPPARADDAPGPRGPSLRILLVDDHEAVRATTAAMLQDLGHSVEAVGDGDAMLAALAAAPAAYDLLVSDYAMPHMSGSEALEKARAIRADLPGIIISGYADAEAIAHKPEGVVVLTKPFTDRQLARTIERLAPRTQQPAGAAEAAA